MLDLIHDIFGEHPYFALCVAVFAVGILLFLTARLVRSYPIIFLAVVFVLGASVTAFIDGRSMLGVYWLVFSAIAVIASGLHFYKNIRGAFWWSLGAVIAMIVAALPLGGGAYEPDPNAYKLVGILIPVVIFLAIGCVGSLLVPRLIYKDKDQRKHRTNTESLIGQRVRINRETEDGHILRGYLGDVDWQIEAYLPNESFKVGDLVVIHHIKGVTLVCTRDGKDLRAEQAEKRRAEAEKAKIENEKKRANREAEKAAHRLENEKQKAKREEEKAKEESELRKIRAERAAQKAKEDEEFRKVREARLAAARARKEELAKEKAAAKGKKEKAPKAQKEPKPAKEEPKAVEKPVKEEKAEKVVKEQPAKAPREKRAKIKTTRSCGLTKREFIYICLSAAIVLVCIIIIVLCCIKGLRGSGVLTALFFVFFALALAYLIAIFILEALNGKKGEQKPAEEPKEEVKAEEVKVEEQAPVKKEKAEFVPFSVRMKEADPFVREAYNELKSEVLSYGIKSRVSSTSDRFRLHKKEYVKMVIAGQFLKLYFALNPEDYVNTTYPFDDAGRMGAHKDTPFVFKIKSGLSVRRAKQLINDVASKDGLAQGEVEAHDWAAELENMAAESDEDEE